MDFLHSPLRPLLALWLATTCLCAAPGGLDWKADKGFRAAKVTVPAQGKEGLTLLDPAKTGVRFANVLSDTAAVENQIRLNGSGLALGDVDGDGLCDIYFCGLENANSLYRNLGHWRFEDVTSAAGVACAGQFSMGAVLADGRPARELKAHWLTSMVFLNRGDRFEVHMLPTEAQMAPAFALCVADFDGDAKEDVFLSQNFFAVHSETSRYDAGRGLLLRGDGRGGFNAMPGQESGIRIYGEQRGAAACDYDADGRVDLAVAQNSNQTRLLHNERASPGLRVRLLGPPGNRGGIGAIIRMLREGQPGPARELHAGSGYCSQDGAVQVLASGANKIQILWPGGKQTTADVPPGAKEISVSIAGEAKVLR